MTKHERQDYQLINTATSQVLVEHILAADTFWQRFLGLQGKKNLNAETGLLLVPCASVHTCFMCFNLDLVMLDKKGTILKVVEGVKPWRVVLKEPQTHAIIELKEGSGRRFKVGERVHLQSFPDSKKGNFGLSKKLAFLLPGRQE